MKYFFIGTLEAGPIVWSLSWTLFYFDWQILPISHRWQLATFLGICDAGYARLFQFDAGMTLRPQQTTRVKVTDGSPLGHCWDGCGPAAPEHPSSIPFPTYATSPVSLPSTVYIQSQQTSGWRLHLHTMPNVHTAAARAAGFGTAAAYVQHVRGARGMCVGHESNVARARPGRRTAGALSFAGELRVTSYDSCSARRSRTRHGTFGVYGPRRVASWVASLASWCWIWRKMWSAF